MKFPILPHGGSLVSRLLPEEEKKEALKRVPQMPKVILNERELSDLDMIACGALSPLTGYMGKEAYQSVMTSMRLPGGLPWTIPITLAIKKEDEKRYQEGSEVVLTHPHGELLAILHLKEKFAYDKKKEAKLVYQTTDLVHPGVASLYSQGDIYLAGPVDVLNRVSYDDFISYRKDPKETREIFQERSWKRVAGFQTRNPIHRAHEYIQKCVLESVDGLLIHPLVGVTKDDDVPADIRMKSYEVLIEGYFPKNKTMLSVMPAAMRYGGPREAVFHAIIRKNYGCTHFIVGRDHAGFRQFYGPFDAHEIFDEFEPGELGITPLFFDNTFFCKHCDQMASYRTCPHPSTEHVTLSGTRVRELLSEGKMPPKELTRPEVARVLIEGFQRKRGKG